MASLVTAPLERNFGQIPSLQLMTSSSSFGISQITLQFELSRDIDAAAQDVQAAINASGSTLPRNLQYPPVYSKVNSPDAPMVTLAITSDTISRRALSDIADTLLAQRLSELTGIGSVTVQRNASRNELPKLLRSMPVGATHRGARRNRQHPSVGRDVQFTVIPSVARVITLVLVSYATIIAGVASALAGSCRFALFTRQPVADG